MGKRRSGTRNLSRRAANRGSGQYTSRPAPVKRASVFARLLARRLELLTLRHRTPSPCAPPYPFYISMKFKDLARTTALGMLDQLESPHASVEELFEQLSNSRLDARDHRFVRQLVTGTLKMRDRLDWIVNQFARRPISSLSPTASNVLRLGVYQLLWLDRVPTRAAIHTSVELAKRCGRRGFAGFVNAVLRRIGEGPIHYPDRQIDPAVYLSVYYSHPVWLVRRWVQRWGEVATEALLKANNEPPRLFIRLNRLRADLAQFRAALPESAPAPQPVGPLPDCFEVTQVEGLFESQAYARGLFFVQDVNAGLAAALLGARAGEKVLDACSAPGGKTAQLAMAMGDRGLIAAADRSPRRLRRLRENARRLGLRCLALCVEDGCEPAVGARGLSPGAEIGGTFDRVLVDAPCSSTGIFGRRADARWRRPPDTIARSAERQRALLGQAYGRLRPGGILVYSTCSIEAEENEAVIEEFLAATPSARLEPARDFLNRSAWCDRYVQTLPGRDAGDGSFAARLRRGAS